MATERFTIYLVPEHVEGTHATVQETAVRAEVVEPTGEQGASGYPRYAGGGLVADIDAATPAVEALLVDGAELDYGLRAVILP
ncbi:hypothetical protein GCM10010329_45660 [Streptomyces spiroverticillatus]|uniref:Uncharacterized protein n=1 Tax=Streptomyces finlayi TaxID=67296 RepID=A0A918X058_9ACTN|nr:hypothetical protein [Streptomyces finlayi]GHA17468.1 hypothetical protein GCM10010329_45660 [Streptomyces spiroverticillatus]GHC99365.1 hypothetical protein GCM10010334_42830 [Streptomyces finlayi]